MIFTFHSMDRYYNNSIQCVFLFYLSSSVLERREKGCPCFFIQSQGQVHLTFFWQQESVQPCEGLLTLKFKKI